MDDLYNLHKEAYESMRRTFDWTIDELIAQDNDTNMLGFGQPESYTENRRDQSAPYDDRGGKSRNAIITPFTVLLELIEGKRPLGYYTHSNCASYNKNESLWAVAPFFKLYARYLAEFSGAMQMLSKMRKGPSSLRKHLKVKC